MTGTIIAMEQLRAVTFAQWASICSAVGLDDRYAQLTWNTLTQGPSAELSAARIAAMTAQLGWPDTHATAIWQTVLRTLPTPAAAAVPQPQMTAMIVSPAPAYQEQPAVLEFVVPDDPLAILQQARDVQVEPASAVTDQDAAPAAVADAKPPAEPGPGSRDPAVSRIPDLMPAPVLRRAAAHLIDLMLFVAAGYAAGWILTEHVGPALAGMLLSDPAAAFSVLAVLAVLAGAASVYAPILIGLLWSVFQARFQSRRGPCHGQSVGKALLGLRVVRVDGGRLDFGQVLLREGCGRCGGLALTSLLLALLIVLVMLLGITPPLELLLDWKVAVALTMGAFYAPALKDPRLGWHDRLAGTIVTAA